MRVVYSRPLGGLNDALCQVRKAWVFARDTSRVLALDTRESGLMASFSTLFNFLDEEVEVLLDPDKKTLAEWNSQSIFPQTLNGQLEEFFSRPWPDRFHMIPGAQGAIRLPREDVASDIVVHHQRGGGNHSHRLLRQIRLKNNVSQWLSQEVASLPVVYSAIHIRSTDYTTDTRNFLAQVKKRVGTGLVVLCSDNPNVAEEARTIFQGGQLITLATPLLVSPGLPLHDPAGYSSDEAKLSATKYLLRDVAAMSGAKTFFHTFIDQPGKFGEPRLSGLTRLVGFLVQNPTVRESFLGLSAPSHKQQSILVAPMGKRISGLLAKGRKTLT